jgi:hypothetical protein
LANCAWYELPAIARESNFVARVVERIMLSSNVGDGAMIVRDIVSPDRFDEILIAAK